MHLPGAPRLSSAFSVAPQFNTVTKSLAQIEWYDLLIHSAVVLGISRTPFFLPAVRLETKLSSDFLHEPNVDLGQRGCRGSELLIAAYYLKGNTLHLCKWMHNGISMMQYLLDYPSIQEDVCSICWQCSETRVSGHAHIEIDLVSHITEASDTQCPPPHRQIILKNPSALPLMSLLRVSLSGFTQHCPGNASSTVTCGRILGGIVVAVGYAF